MNGDSGVSHLTALRLSGPSIRETFPVRAVSNVLLSITGLIENAYFVLAESEGLPLRWSKLQIQVMAGFPARGSIVFPIDLQLAAAATIASQISPQQIFSLAKQALELFLKIPSLFKKSQAESTPRVIVEGNNNVVTIVNGDIKITTQKQVVDAMTRSYPELRKLSRQLDKDRIDEFDLQGGNEEESLRISADSWAKLLAIPKPLQDEMIKVLKEQQANENVVKQLGVHRMEKHSGELEGSGDIISFNKKDRTGIISLVDTIGIPPGEYRFTIRSHDTSTSFIAAMLQSRVKVRFFPEVVRKKTSLSITWIEKELSAGAR
jgi:hypothetical protein